MPSAIFYTPFIKNTVRKDRAIAHMHDRERHVQIIPVYLLLAR
jgi:hypothetical protein